MEPKTNPIGCFDAVRFAKDIHLARWARGMTTRTIGKVIGKSHVQVSRWENGKANPTVTDFLCLCYFFDLDPVNYLITENEIPKTEEMFP